MRNRAIRCVCAILLALPSPAHGSFTLLGVGTTPAAAANITFVQGTGAECGSSPCTKAYASNNTSGNSSIVALCAIDNGTNFSVSDSRNTYNLVGTKFTNGSSTCGIYQALNIGAGANTVTCTDTGLAAFMMCNIVEVSGLSTSSSFDKGADASIGATSAFDSGATATTTAANEFVLGIMFNKFNSYTYTAGTSPNFTSIATSTGSGGSEYTEYLIVSSTGAQDCKATASGSASSENIASCRTFK